MTDITVTEPWLKPIDSHHAELPLWDEESQTLFWIDMEPKPAVHRVKDLDLDTYSHATFGQSEFCTGCFLQKGKGINELLVGSKLGLASATWPSSGSKAKLADFSEVATIKSQIQAEEKDWKPVRMNEATSDTRGKHSKALDCFMG